jgi:hypothetical protein
MRFNAFIQAFVPVACGLGFLVFGMVAFIDAGNSQQQFEAKLRGIRAGTIQPDTLIVVRKYVNLGRSGRPHVVFSSGRQPKVNVAATRDFFNSINLGDAVPAYYFPDGYFIPQNHAGDAGAGKWFFLGLGVLIGGGVLAFAFARSRTKQPNGDMDVLRAIIRDRPPSPAP